MLKRLLKGVHDLWVIVGITLLLVLLVDGLLKVWLPEAGGLDRVEPGTAAPAKSAAPFYADYPWADQYWREHRAARAMDWVPYTYWRRQAYDGNAINVDSQGHRRSWQPRGEPTATIWMFGGSAVWGSGVADEETVPSWLSRLLDEAGHPVRVINFGESGYVGTQSLIRLIRALHDRPAPDIVLFYEGANDVYAALQSGRAGWPQNEANRAAEFRATDGLDNYLAAFPRVLEGVGRLAADTPDLALDRLAGEIAQLTADNLRMANAIGREYGFSVYFYWQPTLFARTPVGEHESRTQAAALRVHRDLQNLADAQIAAWHDRNGSLPLVDLSQVLNQRGAALYMDFVHLGPQGNRHIAEAILPEVLDALQRRWLARG